MRLRSLDAGCKCDCVSAMVQDMLYTWDGENRLVAMETKSSLPVAMQTGWRIGVYTPNAANFVTFTFTVPGVVAPMISSPVYSYKLRPNP